MSAVGGILVQCVFLSSLGGSIICRGHVVLKLDEVSWTQKIALEVIEDVLLDT